MYVHSIILAEKERQIMMLGFDKYETLIYSRNNDCP